MSDIQNTSNTTERPPLGFYKAFPGRGVRASVFQNQNSQTGRHYSTVTYMRSYQDENGEWHNSSTLRSWEQSQMSLLVHEASKLQNESGQSVGTPQKSAILGEDVVCLNLQSLMEEFIESTKRVEDEKGAPHERLQSE